MGYLSLVMGYWLWVIGAGKEVMEKFIFSLNVTLLDFPAFSLFLVTDQVTLLIYFHPNIQFQMLFQAVFPILLMNLWLCIRI